MSAKVLNIADARARKRPERESLSFRVEANGDLAIRPVRDDGIVVPAYVVADERVDDLLRRLVARRSQLRNARIFAAHPELRPVAKPTPKRRDICCRRRDGGRRPMDGCRRNTGHEGQCRDKQGEYTPAGCTHQGRRICSVVSSEGTLLKCSHCGEVVT